MVIILLCWSSEVELRGRLFRSRNALCLINDLTKISDAQVSLLLLVFPIIMWLSRVLHPSVNEMEESARLDAADWCIHVLKNFLELFALEIA